MLTQHSSFARHRDAEPTPHRSPRRASQAAAGRVLHLVDADDSGVGAHVLDLLPHLAALGWHAVVAYVPSGVAGDFEERLAGLDVIEKEVLRLEPGRGIRSRRERTLRSLRRFLLTHDHDVVHAHGRRAAMWAELTAGLAPIVHTPNSLHEPRPDLGPTRRSAYRHLRPGPSSLAETVAGLSDRHATQRADDGLAPLALLPSDPGAGRLELLGDPHPGRRRDDPLDRRLIAEEFASIYHRITPDPHAAVHDPA